MLRRLINDWVDFLTWVDLYGRRRPRPLAYILAGAFLLIGLAYLAALVISRSSVPPAGPSQAPAQAPPRAAAFYAARLKDCPDDPKTFSLTAYSNRGPEGDLLRNQGFLDFAGGCAWYGLERSMLARYANSFLGWPSDQIFAAAGLPYPPLWPDEADKMKDVYYADFFIPEYATWAEPPAADYVVGCKFTDQGLFCTVVEMWPAGTTVRKKYGPLGRTRTLSSDVIEVSQWRYAGRHMWELARILQDSSEEAAVNTAKGLISVARPIMNADIARERGIEPKPLPNDVDFNRSKEEIEPYIRQNITPRFAERSWWDEFLAKRSAYLSAGAGSGGR